MPIIHAVMMLKSHSSFLTHLIYLQGIESLKNDNAHQKKGYWLSLKATFGHPFSWKWFSPFSTPKFAYSKPYLHCVWYLGTFIKRFIIIYIVFLRLIVLFSYVYSVAIIWGQCYLRFFFSKLSFKYYCNIL